MEIKLELRVYSIDESSTTTTTFRFLFFFSLVLLSFLPRMADERAVAAAANVASSIEIAYKRINDQIQRQATGDVKERSTDHQHIKLRILQRSFGQ